MFFMITHEKEIIAEVNKISGKNWKGKNIKQCGHGDFREIINIQEGDYVYYLPKLQVTVVINKNKKWKMR